MLTDNELDKDVSFYKQSLKNAEDEIKTSHLSGKALKDVVGLAFEKHRKRLWNYFGFQVSKDTYGALFHIDWCIIYNDKLIAFEEDKGHYMDSCFMERALTGFCKTINQYLKQNKEIPVLIIHSFTKYQLFNEKLEEDLETRKTEIVDQIRKKLVYNTLVNSDRLPPKKWFSKDLYDCYTANVSNELIIKDIKFIQSLIPP